MHDLLVDLGLAWRNVTRRKRRTTIALTSVGFGVVALVLAGGFIDWVLWAMREAMIESRVGHIQVEARGQGTRQTGKSATPLLSDQAPQLQILLAQGHVKAVMPRLSFGGLISYRDSTISFLGEGVDPAKEELLSRSLVLSHGRPLDPADPRGIVMGHGLARSLGVRVGDTVVLMVNTPSGAINGVEAHVLGTFTTAAKAYDDSALRVPITLARSLLRVSGSHAWIVLLDKTEHTETVMAQLRGRLSNSDLQLSPWWTLTDFYEKAKALFSKQVAAMKLIVAMIIVLSISNTLIMSVMERTGEIGTAMALGATRGTMTRRFLLEGVFLGAVGGGFGAMAGLALGSAISAIGIPMPPPPGMERGYVGEILVTLPLMLEALALAVGTALIASVYPARRASRMKIVEALRHIR
jgi:putative ABC transport system permease protein